MNRKQHPLSASVIAALVLATAPSLASAVRLDYTLDVGIEHNDNVAFDIDESSRPISQTYPRAGLGFLLSQDSSMFQASIEGRANYYRYREPFSDSLDGFLNGRFNWVAIPERLHFSVEDYLSVQPIDALVPDGPGNRQQINVLSLGPTLLFRWAQTLNGVLDLRYMNTDAEENEEFNSDRLSAGLRAIKELSPNQRVSLNAQGQRIDFDNDLIARDYDRYDLAARYERDLTRAYLAFDAGYSRLKYRDGDQSSGAPLLRAEVRWNQDRRSRYALLFSSQFSDVASSAMNAMTPGVVVPDRLPVGDTVIDSEPFEERLATFTYSYLGARDTFSVAPFGRWLRYVSNELYDRDGGGVHVGYERTLRPGLRLEANATYEKVEYVTLGRDDTIREYGVGLQKDWTRHWSSRLEWRRHERSSNFFSRDPKQNIVYLSIAYRNR